MFKVICINSGTPGKTRDSFGRVGVYVPDIYIGNEYTVVGENSIDGIACYELAEVPREGNTRYWYSTKFFATTNSDIEEDVLVNTKEECV